MHSALQEDVSRPVDLSVLYPLVSDQQPTDYSLSSKSQSSSPAAYMYMPNVSRTQTTLTRYLSIAPQMLQHTKHAESLASVQLKYFEVTLLSVEGSAAVGLAALGSSLGMHISTVHADAFVNVNEGRISLSRQNLRVRAAWILSLFSLPFCRCLASGRLNHLHYCSPHDPSCLPSLHWQEVFNTGLGSRARQFQRKNMPLTALITSVRLPTCMSLKHVLSLCLPCFSSMEGGYQTHSSVGAGCQHCTPTSRVVKT